MTQGDTGTPDSALVVELHASSAAALAALFDRHGDAIYNYCFRRTASWDAAEDATATVFLELWRGRARVFAHDGSALPWLYGIANNVCRNVDRSSRRGRRAFGRLSAPAAEPDHADFVAERVDSERQMSAVLAAVRRLPPQEQEVLALVIWSGLSYDAAAAALDVPVGTIRSRLSRARSRLTSELPPHEPGSEDPDPAHQRTEDNNA